MSEVGAMVDLCQTILLFKDNAFLSHLEKFHRKVETQYTKKIRKVEDSIVWPNDAREYFAKDTELKLKHAQKDKEGQPITNEKGYVYASKEKYQEAKDELDKKYKSTVDTQRRRITLLEECMKETVEVELRLLDHRELGTALRAYIAGSPLRAIVDWPKKEEKPVEPEIKEIENSVVEKAITPKKKPGRPKKVKETAEK